MLPLWYLFGRPSYQVRMPRHWTRVCQLPLEVLQNRPSEGPVNDIPGEGWANNIPLLPPPRVLNPYVVEQTPPPAESDPSDPAEEDNDPPTNVLLGEDGDAAADEHATNPNSDAPVEADGREEADTTPAADGNTQQPDDDGGCICFLPSVCFDRSVAI